MNTLFKSPIITIIRKCYNCRCCFSVVMFRDFCSCLVNEKPLFSKDKLGCHLKRSCLRQNGRWPIRNHIGKLPTDLEFPATAPNTSLRNDAGSVNILFKLPESQSGQVHQKHNSWFRRTVFQEHLQQWMVATYTSKLR